MGRTADLNDLKELATQLYKYQKFATSIVDKKVSVNYNPPTVRLYHSCMRRYLSNGIKPKKLSKAFWDFIDDLKANHYGILTPPESEKARYYTPRKTGVKKASKVKTTIDKTVVLNNTQSELPTKKIKISDNAVGLGKPRRLERPGIMRGDFIKIFDNEDIRRGYLMGLNDNQSEPLEFDMINVTIQVTE